MYEYGCKLFRKRIECALMLKVAEAMDPELGGAKIGDAPVAESDDCDSCGGCD